MRICDGAGDPLQRVIELFVLQGNQAHQVQGAGVIGIGCQQSLATKLGLQRLPRLQEAMAGLALGGGRERGRFRHRLPGPAFSAVHRPFFGSRRCPKGSR
jgi:hypothetical protein